MKKLVSLALLLIPLAGCAMHHGGSQALSFNPFDIGTKEPAVRVANDHQFVDGVPMDLRR